jgi:hypothetical protein
MYARLVEKLAGRRFGGFLNLLARQGALSLTGRLASPLKGSDRMSGRAEMKNLLLPELNRIR